MINVTQMNNVRGERSLIDIPEVKYAAPADVYNQRESKNMSGTFDVYRTINRVFVAVILTFILSLTYVTPAEISDLRLCGDRNCKSRL